MIRINLLSEARAAAARRKAPAMPTGAKLNNMLFLGGILAGVAYIAIMGLVLTSKRRHLDQEIGKARLEAERLRSIIEEVKGYEEKKSSLEAKIKLINDLKTNQKGPVRLMDEISKALPDLVWLTSLDVGGNQITMRGRTLSPNAVSTYLENLKKSPFFAEPVFRNLQQEGATTGLYVWEMALTFIPSTALTGAPAGGAAAAPAAPAPGRASGT
ncbi:MAG: PilN domain-containing protein [Thermoanaerobaculia bacterium]